MTDREKILSNEYYDMITDYELPPQISLDIGEDFVYQPIDGELGITYINRNNVPPLGISNYSYTMIPKLYGLQQIQGSGRTGTFDPTPLIESGITRVQRTPLDLTGKGVVIGFVDTGIRYEEEVFRNPDGSTRILGIWDQTIQDGEPPEGILYGTEYTREMIDMALQSDNPREIVPSYDENGHGTALASVAAGSVLGSGLTFVGAAPEADIVMVKLRQAKSHLKEFYLVDEAAEAYSESDILVAIKYLESYAIAVSRALIICFGLGTNMGDHEGHSALADYLNQIAVRRSRVVVVAGGNEGNSAHHYVGVSEEGLRETADNVEIRVDQGEIGFTAELWGNISSNHIISIKAPGGEVTPRVDFRNRNSLSFGFIYEDTQVQIDHVLVEQDSGEELIFFRFVNPTPGVWTIQVVIAGNRSGESDFHIWLPLTGFLRGETYFLRPSPYITLTEPSNAGEVITTTVYDDTTGSFWALSGRGYTRRGQIKPELCAPGVDIDTILGVRTGSALAAAFVSGAAALFMQWAVEEQNRPWVESRELKSYLIRGAARDAGVVYPNRETGYGKLDISGTFDVLAGV
ncbi:MAG: S8 family peptidase [Lachnospiraceae bacterium]|nr:S8 family peptidase [Lachnospiraceae bacterium]